MNCDEAKYYLALYSSGELDARSMADFELHVEHCKSCTRDVELNNSFDGLLRGAFAEHSPDAEPVRDRVRHQIRGEVAGRPKLRRLWPLAASIAAVLLVASTGLFFYTRGHSGLNPVYQAAIDDHRDEIVRLEPRKSWRDSPEEIDALLRAHLPDPSVTARVAPPQYHLARAKICDLDGRRFLHLVYQDGEHQMSVFLAAKADDGKLAPASSAVAGIHQESREGLGVVGFQSSGITVLFVSDLPSADAAGIAREAEKRLESTT